ncbi:MAG: 2-C-methyl-D-erythritol 4-phosphate cytidylyltransferase [Myxococcota bacterium]
MSRAGSVAALVLGAGRGERLGHALPKAFVPLAGQTLLEHSLAALAASGVFAQIVPVLAAADFARFETLELAGIAGLATPVAGGAERQDSMAAGLRSLPPEIEFVAVHDAARCLVTVEDLRRVVAAARETGAALLGEPVRDTLKRVDGTRVVETPNRALYWAAQTPQVMRRDWLAAAIAEAEKAGRQATDDAQLIEWAGHEVTMVGSTGPNPKITLPVDLLLGELLLSNRREERS